MERSLAGKTILVTGASRGLGQAFCRTFAQHGARIALTYTRDEEGAAATVKDCEEQGAEARSFKVSVLDGPGTQAMVEELERAWSGIDVLVNNAGISQNLPIALLDEKDWDQVMDINVKGSYLTARAVLRGMIRRKSGQILNVGSLAGMRMLEAPVHYCASKAAVAGMTRAMAKELSRYGIRVNCLAPGLLEDGVGRNLPDYRLAEYLKHCALRRVGTFEEVARFAVFLLSDANTYMNGETVLIDGGL